MAGLVLPISVFVETLIPRMVPICFTDQFSLDNPSPPQDLGRCRVHRQRHPSRPQRRLSFRKPRIP